MYHELYRCRQRLTLAAACIFLAAAVACAAVLLAGGCAARYSSVNGLPAGVTAAQAKKWDVAIANLHKIAIATAFVRQGIMDVNKATPLDKDYYSQFLRHIAQVDELQLSASEVLREQPEYFGSTQTVTIGKYAQDILDELGKLTALGVTGIKNADAQKHVNTLLADLAASAKLVLELTQ